MSKVFISTFPFGRTDRTPLDLLEKNGIEYLINPLARKIKPEELAEIASGFDGLIAGTENVNHLLGSSKRLKIISRVGIGLDSVPLSRCREMGVTVTYTPDAVTLAVVELTIGLMVSMTRKVLQSDRDLRLGKWYRPYGKRLGGSIIGIIGFGRVGARVARYLSPFSPKKILVNDIRDKTPEIDALKNKYKLNIEFSEKEKIYAESDIITLHVPLTGLTKNMINKDALNKCRDEGHIINTSRGGIINEDDLYQALKNGKIAGAAIDAFEVEPYKGPLVELDNIILTQHMGSCSFDCRSRMETEATEDMIRFLKNEPLANEVPPEELEYQNICI